MGEVFPFAIKLDEDVSHINVNSVTGEWDDGSPLMALPLMEVCRLSK